MAAGRSQMPARVEAHDAIVLRTLRYGESDVIAHLFTLEEGRLNVIAKRGRSAKTSLGARLEPYTQVRVQVARGRGGLGTVRALDLARPTHALRDRWRRQQAAAAGLDTLGRLFAEGQSSEAAFHLTERMLDLLDAPGAFRVGAAGDVTDTPTDDAPVGTDGHVTDIDDASGTDVPPPTISAPVDDEDERIAAVLVAYGLKLLHVYGVAPVLGSCVRCGTEVPEQLTSWSAADGGVVCEACRTEGDASITPGTREAAAWLLRASLGDIAVAPELPDPRDLRGAAQRVLGSLCDQHAGFRPKLPTG